MDEILQNKKTTIDRRIKRNIAVHNYSSINLEVVKDIIENRLTDLQHFALQMLKLTSSQ